MPLLEQYTGQHGLYPDSALKSSGQSPELNIESSSPEPSVTAWKIPREGSLDYFVGNCLFWVVFSMCDTQGVWHSPSCSLAGSFWDVEGPVGPNIAKGIWLFRWLCYSSTVKLGFLKLLFLFWVFWKDMHRGMAAYCGEQNCQVSSVV